MRIFFQSLVQSVCKIGIKEVLAEVVPGGRLICQVCEEMFDNYRKRANQQKILEETRELASAVFQETRDLALDIVREEVKKGTISPNEQEIDQLANYMGAVPDATRQSLKRREDPTGRTVPPDFQLRQASDLIKLLPPRPPRFREGDPLPHRPGWSLQKLLGLGGFGEVWLARSNFMTQTKGAVKFAFDQQARDLIHESNLIRRVTNLLEHQPQQGIVPLLDACIEPGLDTPWLMYEYVQGVTMTEWIHQLAGLQPAARLSQASLGFQQLASSVSFCHQQNPPIVHRDLKPANVIFDNNSKKLRITDFGIGGIAAAQAHREERQGTMTQAGRLITSLRGSYSGMYSSPQQRNGNDPCPQDDVHALGVIAYQLLTAQTQLGPGPDFVDDLKDHHVPEALQDIVKDCVASRQERRLASAMNIVERLSMMSRQTPQQSNSPAPSQTITVSPAASTSGIQSGSRPTAKPQLRAGELSEITLRGGVKMSFAWCPPGTFQMGGDKYNDEKPVHEVRLTKGVWMGVTPVTQSQWQAVMGNNPSHFKGPQRPVEEVSWEDAVEFCRKLSELPEEKAAGRVYRLPTEAEWEYACRAGSQTAYSFGDDARLLKDFAWFSDNSNSQTHPVGQKKPNAWGLYDMHGNVWEWCGDWYGDYPRGSATDPTGPKERSSRVYRGGSWLISAGNCRAAYRDGDGPSDSYDILGDLGLRLARVPTDGR
jgi:formylglycine-generating enzyme required for sulfatase activity